MNIFTNVEAKRLGQVEINSTIDMSRDYPLFKKGIEQTTIENQNMYFKNTLRKQKLITNQFSLNDVNIMDPKDFIPLWDTIDEKTRDYFFLRKTLDMFQYAGINDSFRLILSNSNTDLNFVPDEYEKIIILSKLQSDLLSLDFLKGDMRVSIEDKQFIDNPDNEYFFMDFDDVLDDDDTI